MKRCILPKVLPREHDDPGYGNSKRGAGVYHYLSPLRAPGYIERVWNIEALSGIAVAGLPIEELLFAAAFGAYWSGVYEHFTWRQPAVAQCKAPERHPTMST